MSLCINATTAEGMVLATDSRQSYRNQKGMARIGSDSATKIFQLSSRVGLVVAGLAFLPEDGTLKNVSNFVKEFISANSLDKMAVEEIAEAVRMFFEEKYQYKPQLDLLPQQIEADLKIKGCEILKMEVKKDHIEFSFKDPSGAIQQGVGGVDPLQFIVAGYNKDESHYVYMINIPGDKLDEKRSSIVKEKAFGASWIGQTDVLTRIVLGFDGRIGNLPFIQQVGNQIGHNVVQQQLRGLEYIIQWGTMTLQDAIDFCKLSIETTTAIQRFSDGIAMSPGDMPGVGGPIDIAVITPKKGLVWVSKKNLKIDDQEVDLDNFKDIAIDKPKKEKNGNSKASH